MVSVGLWSQCPTDTERCCMRYVIQTYQTLISVFAESCTVAKDSVSQGPGQGRMNVRRASKTRQPSAAKSLDGGLFVGLFGQKRRRTSQGEVERKVTVVEPFPVNPHKTT